MLSPQPLEFLCMHDCFCVNFIQVETRGRETTAPVPWHIYLVSELRLTHIHGQVHESPNVSCINKKEPEHHLVYNAAGVRFRTSCSKVQHLSHCTAFPKPVSDKISSFLTLHEKFCLEMVTELLVYF